MKTPALYIVRKDLWYVERTVWLIAGLAILAGTLIALGAPRAGAMVLATVGLASVINALTGVCALSTALLGIGFRPLLAVSPPPTLGPLRVYRMRTDRWFLERGVYLVVGINMTLASLLSLAHSAGWLAFTGFVGVASVVFAFTGFCPIANALYRFGLEPRLAPGDTGR